MTVKVCDALCGSGKTQSCIKLINDNPDRKYIFITPYLDEVERIKRSCSTASFVSPERRFGNGYSKLNDLHSLLASGVNIASTHALFANYTDETKSLIRANNYTLILDEVIDLFQPLEFDSGDIDLLVRHNVARREDDTILWNDDEYSGVLFSDIMNMSKSKNLIDYDGSFFFWVIPIDVFNCFQDAYVLTYLFDAQLLKSYFDANDIRYEYIGTRHVFGTDYEFCPIDKMDRKIDLRNKIHICSNEKYNRIGNGKFSLSASWFDRENRKTNSPAIQELKNNLYNYFRKENSSNDDKMWTTLNRCRNVLKGKGYSSSFIVFNKRASNDYANKHKLAYCLNVFIQPWVKNYLLKVGVSDVNQDMYALSVLIQWIFRSAIRKGEEVWIYIPSKRMRYLLRTWIDNLAEGKDLEPIYYQGDEEKKKMNPMKKIPKKNKGTSKQNEKI